MKACFFQLTSDEPEEFKIEDISCMIVISFKETSTGYILYLPPAAHV